jgi:hypothetical protein
MFPKLTPIRAADPMYIEEESPLKEKLGNFFLFEQRERIGVLFYKREVF